MIDTEPIARAAWESFLERYGHTLDQATVNAIFGLRLVDSAATIQERYDLPLSPAQIAEERDAIFFNYIEGQLKPRAGLFNLIEALHSRPVLLGLATSGHRQYTEVVLDTLGLHDAFDAVVTGDDVVHGKPAPDIYLLAAEQLGVRSDQCVVLEDAPHGVTAAKSAGMTCIAVPNEMTEGLDFSAADEVFPNLDAAQEYLTAIL